MSVKKAKQMAFLGLLAAVVTLLIIFASVIETNTLFLLAAGSFLVGVAIREFGIPLGVGFLIACSLLGVLIAPNKLYVITFVGLALYILWSEVSYLWLSKSKLNSLKKIHLLLKFICFNLIYMPILFFLPQLIFQGTISNIMWIGFAVAGQLGWIIYDKAYDYFQSAIWTKLRNRAGFFR